MSSLKYMHDVKAIAIQRMFAGYEKHGFFNAFSDTQELPIEGLEEATDSYNYAKMEAQKTICRYELTTEDCEELLQMLESIESASLVLGVKWCEFEAALNERLEDKLKVRIQDEKPGT